MPITKEHVLSIVNEGLAMRDYHDRFRSQLRAITTQYKGGQDPAVCMELVDGLLGDMLGERQRPPMEITYAEKQKLNRRWGMNEWHKRHQQMRRDIAKWGGDPNDAQMYPRPEGGSTYTHVGVAKEDYKAATARAKQRAEWLAERISRANDHMKTLNQTPRGDAAVSGWTRPVDPLTEAEWDKIIKPDDASALPLDDQEAKS